MSRSRRIFSLILLLVAAVLAVCLVVVLIRDWVAYTMHPEWSAPYYAYLVIEFFQFGLPAAFCLIVALVLRRREPGSDPDPAERSPVSSKPVVHR